jgi:hypothetical protein
VLELAIPCHPYNPQIRGVLILEVISDMGLKRLPLLPSQLTMHLMAKAAVAVYEAAVGNDDRGQPSEEAVDG